MRRDLASRRRTGARPARRRTARTRAGSRAACRRRARGRLPSTRPTGRARTQARGRRAACRGPCRSRTPERARPPRTRASRPSAWAQYTSPPATSTGRAGCADERRRRCAIASGSGVARRDADRVDRGQLDRPGTERVERDVDERRPAVRRARGAARGVDLGDDRRGRRRGRGASSSTDATIGTWSSSCSEPAPHGACGARPPSTTIGEPFMPRRGHRAHAVGHARPGGERRAAEPARHLRPAFGRERRGLLVAHVDEPQVRPAPRRRRARTGARPTA